MTNSVRTMRSSSALYDLLAPTYDEHFAVPLRRAYDELAWDLCGAVIPPPPAVVVDVGCGVGRWAQRLLTAGHRVVGIEPAPRMAEEAANRLRGWTGTEFTLLTAPVEDVELQPGTVDVVLAIGSLQYTADPVATLRQTTRWLRRGGRLCVLVDSLHALVIELLRADRPREASDRLETRRGNWRIDGAEADLHLLDEAALRAAMVGADLEVVQVAGLLVGASAHGRAELTRRVEDDYESALAVERALAAVPAFADLGKQLLMIGRR